MLWILSSPIVSEISLDPRSFLLFWDERSIGSKRQHAARNPFDITFCKHCDKLSQIALPVYLCSFWPILISNISSCDQAALSMGQSVHLSVTPFSTMFPSSYHLEIFRSTKDRINIYAKGQGQMSKVKITEVKIPFRRFRTVTPVNSQMMMKWCTKLGVA